MIDAANKLFSIPLVSVLTGALITWFAAWYYYKRAGTELQEEAQRLKSSSDLIIYCLTNRDAKITANYDAAGNISGLTVNMEANLSGSGTLDAKLDGVA